MLTVKICPVCKTTNETSAENCKACNASLSHVGASTMMVPGELPSLPTSMNQDFISRLPENTLALMIMGERKPVLLSNQGKLFLGRFGAQEQRPAFDFTPFGAERLGVSRQHAALMSTEKGYLLEDLGSANGTWVNATRLIPYTPHMLRSGDLMRLGQLTSFVYFKKSGGSEQQTISLRFQTELTMDESAASLTANILLSHVAPYLKALSDIQGIISELLSSTNTLVHIQSMTYDPSTQTCEVALSGARQVCDWALSEVVEWRAQYQTLLKEALKKQAEGFPQTPTAEETHPVKREYDNLWMKIRYAQIALTQACVDRLNNELSDQQKSVLTRRLMPHVQLVTTSILDIRPPKK
jgi:hypothetical protein